MFPGLLRLLAVTGPPDPDGRDGLDHHEDLVSEDDRRGRQGVRQTEVRGSSRGTAASLKYRNMKNTSNNNKSAFKCCRRSELKKTILVIDKSSDDAEKKYWE